METRFELCDDIISISMPALAIPKSSCTKYLNLFNKFSLELLNLVMEDTIQGNATGKYDTIYRQELNSIPCIMNCTIENMNELVTPCVQYSKRGAIVYSDYFSKYDKIDDIAKAYDAVKKDDSNATINE